MIGCAPDVDWRLIGAILFGLAMFGAAYNALIAVLAHRKAGYTSLLVTGGVLVTLGGLALIDWRCALLAICMFVASGTPMIIGDILRHVREREQAMREYKDRFDVQA